MTKLLSYDRTMIRGIVIAAYLGWIAFGAVSILLPSPVQTGQPQSPFHAVAASILVLFWALFARQHSPWTFYIYIAFPCYFWDHVLARASKPLWQYIREGQPGSVVGPVLRGVLVVAALQSMVVSITLCLTRSSAA